jgi:hypothetical protein
VPAPVFAKLKPVLPWEPSASLITVPPAPPTVRVLLAVNRIRLNSLEFANFV